MKRRTLLQLAAALLVLCLPLMCVLAQEEFIIIGTFEDVSPVEIVEDGRVEILISATGDVTLGGNRKGNPGSTIYTREYDAQGGNYGFAFRNVRDLFAQDDLTLVNFEGTLTNHTQPRNSSNEFLFRMEPEHVQALTFGNVEAVTVENNHTLDFGEQGLADTLEALAGQGIVYARDGQLGVYEARGVKIGLLAYQTFNNAYERLHSQVPVDIAAAKESCDLVIVSYHWGEELDYAPHDRQVKLGRATIDAGADLVLGHHSHRINPIEYYNGRYIVYSLANFSFSGNVKPSDMDSFIFQQKFILEDGALTIGDFRILPCRISSTSSTNDFAPTLYEEGSKDAQRVIDRMLKEGKSLKYAVEHYPTQWPED